MGRGRLLPLRAGTSTRQHRLTHKEPTQQRLLGWGEITFRDPRSVQRILQAAHNDRGVLRVPYAAPSKDPSAIAYTEWADVERACETRASLRDAVSQQAPLAQRAQWPLSPDHFFVKVERRARAPRTDAPTRDIAGFTGFA